jgi:phenylalanyl-tRNA synthetase alpha subunit
MVIERPKPEQPKPVNEPKAKVKVISAQERESKAMAIERLLREARYYERELNSILHYKQKYANRGEKRESRVRIRYASAKITEYFNANESESESDKREWKRHVKGILKWIMIIGMV